MSTRDAIVVGAGIGGTAIALALLRRGWSVRIFEQAAMLGEIGAGITVSPNAMRCLISLGLEQEVMAIASIPDKLANLHYQTGDTLFTRAMGGDFVEKYGAPYCHIHRADLHTTLVDAVRAIAPDAFHLNSMASDVTLDAAGATIRFADGEEASAALVVAADGVRSTLRALLLDDTAPRFTRRIVWRAVIPASIAAPVGLPTNMGAFIGGGRSVGYYTMRKDALLNLTFMSGWDEWIEEDWRARSDIADVRTAYADWCPAVRQLIDLLPPDNILRWGLFDRPPTTCWNAGRLVFLGDAIHPMLPYVGQGAAMAVEDAVVLARALDERPSIEAAISSYVASRQPRTAWVHAISRERAEFWERSDLGQFAGDTKRIDANLAIYPYDAATVTLADA